MKFTCDKASLQEVTNIVQKAAATNSTLTILMGILLTVKNNKLKLTCNNLEIAIECTIDAQIEKEGSVVVNSRLFSDIIKKLACDLVHISVNDNFVTNITGGGSNYDILGISAEEFPLLPSVDEETKLVLTQKELKELIKSTIFAAGTSENKLILTGCLLKAEENNIVMVAVDGYRLALRQIAVKNEIPNATFVIPAKNLGELNKIITDSENNIQIIVSNKNISFDFEGVRFVSRLLDGEFIDYEKIIPKDFTTNVRVTAAELENAAERASLIITNELVKSPLEISISQAGFEISCETQVGKSEERIYPEIIGEDLTIGFNHHYLLDAIKVCPDDEYYMGFGTNLSPCLLYPSNGKNDFKYIILPVRLRSNG